MTTRFRLRTLLALLVLLAPALLAGQALAANDRPVRWESGDSWSGAPGWGSYASLTPSAGSSYILTTYATGSGNRYLRFADDDSTNRYGPSGSSDIQLFAKTSVNLQAWNQGSGKAYYVAVADAAYNYVFKTDGTNDGKVILFEVQGAVQSLAATSRTPSGTVWPGTTVTVNATLSGAFAIGQGAYLRYTNDNWNTSAVVTLSCTGTSCSGTIPSAAQAAGATVAYYLFTSGDGLTIAPADADYYTINLLNNGGGNYAYAVQPDGWLDEEYGATQMVDLAANKSGDQDACEGDEKSDLIDFGAFSYDASSASAGRWFISFTIDSIANLNSGTQQGYIIALDTGTKGSPTIDLSSAGTWQRNVAFPGDYFIGLYPSGADTLSAGLYDSSRNAVAGTSVTAITRKVATRRQIELTLGGAGMPAELTNNSAVNLLLMSVSDANGDNVNDAIGDGVTTECATGKTTYAQADMRASGARCKANGRPTSSGANDRQCTSNPRRDAVSTLNSGATCSVSTDSITIDGAVDAGKYSTLFEETFAGPYTGGATTLSDFDGESAAFKFYTDPNAGTSTTPTADNLYDASANGSRRGAADVELVYARADSNYFYLIVEGPSALGGAGTMSAEPYDRSNLYIALDTPLVTSSTDTGGTGAGETPNAPAARRVNFKGWAPDYVIEVVWAGDNATANNVHLHDWTSGTTWTNVGSFTTVLSQGTGPTTGDRLFGRSAFGSDGDRKGRFEFALRWAQIGGKVSSVDELKMAVYTTGDTNLGTVNADDWDVFDQGPGIGQGCTGFGCHERIGDDPGDGDGSAQSGGESDETPYVGQTDTSGDVEPGSDRAARDVDTIEGYYVFTANAQLLACAPLAVDLAAFTAERTAERRVMLRWETVAETNNAGFNILRAGADSGPWEPLNANLIPASAPGSAEGHVYAWTDTSVKAGNTYWYMLEDVGLDGTITLHGPVSLAVNADGPNSVSLLALEARGLAVHPVAWAVLLLLPALALVVRRMRRR